MRRMLSFTLAAITSLALAACASAPSQPAAAPTAAPVAAAPTTAAPAAAAATLGSLTINDPWIRPANPDAPPPTAMPNTTPMAMGGGDMPAAVNTGGYLTIVNSGAEADALIAASAASDVSEVVELHTVIEEGGMMKMRPVEKIEVPANGEAVLKPGSFHIMFIGVKHELKPGDTVKLTLTFEKAGSVEFDAVVRPANPMP